VTLRESNIHPIPVPVQRLQVRPTPRNVVASHDELDPRKPLDEVAQSASQIERSGGGEALPDVPATQKVSAADVDRNLDEGRGSPARRYVGGQELRRELNQFASELERTSKAISDEIGVPRNVRQNFPV